MLIELSIYRRNNVPLGLAHVKFCTETTYCEHPYILVVVVVVVMLVIVVVLVLVVM